MNTKELQKRIKKNNKQKSGWIYVLPPDEYKTHSIKYHTVKHLATVRVHIYVERILVTNCKAIMLGLTFGVNANTGQRKRKINEKSRFPK